ncbi:hypothetical protein LTR91_014496 [Friedmanniomyces endolithicus]|uniref:Uncharacterized protein n=1 Tax=Friedmanniomyces endolithicus TaxID=329885 RepID=A0AAN6KBN2_9PEZI|nr:hypothetical protein LTR94_003954 [Friedmanniomyces endolithicus]KAK0788527.1 hypothetical protein LTR38_011257 [Friedmanniomyces endolithicus]KAK0814249.1 hypothetical protein LTR59_000786 [Friedmanniomyces endolithicus]KAK0818687.1 hypothetical protein LTR75_002601 [Friedmanniomyces endolithicus]KAK0845533.1 hypothetical protein LTR03_007423 [Friedmanniomyces endolithicus]
MPLQPLQLQQYAPLPQSGPQHNFPLASPRRQPRTASRAMSLALYIFIAILMLDCALEMGLLSATVYWLHYRAGKDFIINNPGGGIFSLHGKPAGLLVDQGHTSNGAAGTAFVAVGLIGIFAFCLRRRARRTANTRPHKFATFMYNFWFTIVILNTLLCLGALLYTFYLTLTHEHQHMNIVLASGLNNRPYPNYVAYPDLLWTPENWLTAVLELPLASSGDRTNIQLFLTVQKIWRYNLVPMLILQTVRGVGVNANGEDDLYFSI